MTHERVANVEGGEYGQDWLEDAASEVPQPLLVELEVGGAQMPGWDPEALSEAEADVGRERERGEPAEDVTEEYTEAEYVDGQRVGGGA